MGLFFAFVVESRVDVFQLAVGDVGVNLRCSDGGMAEKSLDGTDVSAVD